MSISDNYVPIRQLGNGVTTQFSASWAMLKASYARVYLESVATGVQTLQSNPAQYTISITSSGFTVTFVTAPTSANYVVIGREVALDQTDPYRTAKGFQGSTHEDSYDKLTAICQDQQDAIDRSLTTPLGDTATNLSLPTVTDRALKYIAFDASGNVIATAGAGSTTPISAAMAPVVAGSTLALARSAMDVEQKASSLSAVTATQSDYVVISDVSDSGNSKKALISDIVSMSGIDNGVQDFRLSLTSGLPVTTSDVTSATTLYAVPRQGNRIALYDGAAWNMRTSAQFSLALGTLSNNTNYDVFCYDNASVPTLEFTAWTNDTTRATALAYQDGVLVKSGTATRRYLGTFRTTSTTTTEDSFTKRRVWNYYQRAVRPLKVTESTASWNYTTATYRQANGSTANQVDAVIGVAEDVVEMSILSLAANSGGNVVGLPGVGIDSTSTNSADLIIGAQLATGNANGTPLSAKYAGIPAAGYHYYAWLEYSGAGGTTTWYSNNLGAKAGLVGRVMG